MNSQPIERNKLEKNQNEYRAPRNNRKWQTKLDLLAGKSHDKSKYKFGDEPDFADELMRLQNRVDRTINYD